jgi:hypothetical protein
MDNSRFPKLVLQNGLKDTDNTRPFRNGCEKVWGLWVICGGQKEIRCIIGSG